MYLLVIAKTSCTVRFKQCAVCVYVEHWLFISFEEEIGDFTRVVLGLEALFDASNCAAAEAVLSIRALSNAKK